jgi:hypothetical protein
VIGKGAFRNNLKLQTALLSDSITVLSSEIFSGNTSLHTLNIPLKATTIEEKALFNLVALRELKLPSSLVSIETSGIEGLSTLTQLVVPDSIRSISNRALASATALTILHLPYKLANLGSDALLGNRSLTTIFYCGNLTGLPLKATCTDDMKRKIDEAAYQEEKEIRDRQRESAPTPGITGDLTKAINAVTDAALLATESSAETQKIAAEISTSLNATTEKIKVLSNTLSIQAASLTSLLATNLNIVMKVAKKLRA